jgi:DNA cross-link repair 1C protein
MNFAKGILESRLQTYRHLKNLLKTIPLETPTAIELRPGYEIRVTLFDANHCVGAVMFLIEGQGKAILYTGDIRSETWWVNQLVQNPVLLPYADCIKSLDCIYLDTTFASKTDRYREFASKADGLKELARKVSQYPNDTIFYVEAWTFGYENVWVALSSLLNTQVHLDRYRWSLYRSLAATASGAIECPEARRLCGFQLGNHRKEGCLTVDLRARLHSCEKGTGCPVIHDNSNVVRILPIISRLPDGGEMHELGLGGGKGDLDQIHELEVDDAAALRALMQLCVRTIDDKNLLLKIFALLNASSHIDLGSDMDSKLDQDEVKLEDLVAILSKVSTDNDLVSPIYKAAAAKDMTADGLPKTITFPYSRHSSYSELCNLLQTFRPKDVYPCTVDEAKWSPAVSMASLFGHLCSETLFDHDAGMMAVYEERSRGKRPSTDDSQTAEQTQRTDSSADEDNKSENLAQQGSSQVLASSILPSDGDKFFTPVAPSSLGLPSSPPAPAEVANDPSAPRGLTPRKRPFASSSPTDSPSLPRSRPRKIRKWAYMAAAGMGDGLVSWDAFGGLNCVRVSPNEEEL